MVRFVCLVPLKFEVAKTKPHKAISNCVSSSCEMLAMAHHNRLTTPLSPVLK